MGTVFSGVERVLLHDRIAILRRSESSIGDTVDLRHVDLIFIRGSGPVGVKTLDRLQESLTIVSTTDIALMGGLDCPGTGLGVSLALVTLGDIVIPSDPDLTGDDDWESPWDIRTNGHLVVGASIAALGGSVRSENPGLPRESMVLNVRGGVIQEEPGRLGTTLSGHTLNISYDRGLLGAHPPYFPPLERWVQTSWEMDPDYGGLELDANMF
jgi:hypothetical protein